MNNLRQLLETLRHQCDDGESTVLATIVQVSGSSYRRPGAMMLLTQENQRCGMISGGCLEKDLALKAWRLTESGSRVVAYDTRGRFQQPAGEFGAGCEGVIHVLLERLAQENWLLDLLNSIVLDRQPRRTATVFRSTASATDTPLFHVGQRFFENCSDKDYDAFASGQLSSGAAIQTIQFYLNRSGWETESFSLRLQNEQGGQAVPCTLDRVPIILRRQWIMRLGVMVLENPKRCVHDFKCVDNYLGSRCLNPNGKPQTASTL